MRLDASVKKWLIVTISILFLGCEVDNTISVWVNVSGNNDEIANRAATYLNDELRRLQNVEVWNNVDAEWQLVILIIEVEINGNIIGYIGSMLVTRNSFVYEEVLLRTIGHQQGLRVLCEKMITDFDHEYLEPER